jgi:hypothetical protein
MVSTGEGGVGGRRVPKALRVFVNSGLNAALAMVGRGLFRFHRFGGLGAWRLLKVPRRTVRAPRGRRPVPPLKVFVLPLTRGNAAGPAARSAAALPRAIGCQAFSLKSRILVASWSELPLLKL